MADAQAVGFSHDRSRFAVASKAKVTVYDLSSLAPVSELEGNGRRLEFSPDGELIASWALYSRSLQVNRVADGKRIATLEGHSHEVWDAAFSPNGELLALASFDQTISIWSAQNWELLTKLEGHESAVVRVAFLPDGKLYSGGEDGRFCVWNLDDLDRPTWPLAKSGICNYSGWFRPQTSFSSDGQFIATTMLQLVKEEVPKGGDRDVPGFAIRSAESLEIKELVAESGAVKTGIIYSPVENLIAVGDQEGCLQFFDMDNPLEVTKSIQLQENTNLYPIKFTRDGQQLLCSTRNGKLHFADDQPMCFVVSVKECKLIASWELPRAQSDHRRQFPTTISPDGEIVVSGHGDGIRLWNVADPATHIHLPLGRPSVEGKGDRIFSLDFSPDGSLLAVGNSKGLIELLDMSSRRVVGELLGHRAYIGGLAFSPDGARLASVSPGSTGFKLWDVVSQREILSMKIAHTFGNRHVEWSADGNSVMTMSGNSKVHVWRVPPR